MTFKTTHGGDDGMTTLYSGEEVSKTSPRINCVGIVDELSSWLGVCKYDTVTMSTAIDIMDGNTIPSHIENVQEDLFILCAELATDRSRKDLLKHVISKKQITWLDTVIELYKTKAVLPDGFVIPAGSPSAAKLDYARTICRRAERNIVKLKEKGLLHNKHILVYLNRLSDLLWILARMEERGSYTKYTKYSK